MTRAIPKLQPGLFDELVVDNFAGGGGASLGIELGIGRAVDIAINHNPKAVAMHMVNHPYTRHYCEDVWSVDPIEACAGRPVGLAWFSPDCKHFSKAKGGKPVSRKIRGLAWIVIKWAQKVRPRIIMLENVEEFQDWGPLVQACDSEGKPRFDKEGNPELKPCGVNKGATFYKWVNRLEGLGYKIEWDELRACDYGAPTIRKRLFLIARCDGLPIVWPGHTRGPKTDKPYRTAAECIDWSIPCPSIFSRPKNLADNTLRRIVKGTEKYTIEAEDPFIVTCNHGGSGFRGQDINKPMCTVTAANDAHGVVNPFIVPIANYNGSVTAHSAGEPLRTITANPKGGAFALASPTLIQTGYGERKGQRPRYLDIKKPLGTVVAGGNKHALVMAHVQRQFGKSVGSSVAEPVGTITAGGSGKTALVSTQVVDSGFLVKHYGGVTGVDVRTPAPTTTTRGTQNQLVLSHVMKLRGTNLGHKVNEPLHTISAGGTHHAEVRTFLVKYFGTATGQSVLEPLHTVTTKDRYSLISVDLSTVPITEDQRYNAWWVARLIEKYSDNHKESLLPGPRCSAIGIEQGVIVDIGMRMFAARELYRCQGFHDEYVIDPIYNGKPLTKTDQVAMCGNSVSPPPAMELVKANVQIKAAISQAA